MTEPSKEEIVTAKAICRSVEGDDDEIVEQEWYEYRDQAIAAIHAMQSLGYVSIDSLIEMAEKEIKDKSMFTTQAEMYNNGIINHKINWLKQIKQHN